MVLHAAHTQSKRIRQDGKAGAAFFVFGGQQGMFRIGIRSAILLCTLVFQCVVWGASLPVNQLPLGAQVVSGSVAVSQTKSASSAGMSLVQTSQNAIVNWQAFNLGSGSKLKIIQPNSTSTLLNRVLGSDPSQILGQISANGQVFLTNPNGIYFAPGSSVDVGSFLATTHSISDKDFLEANYSFSRNGAIGRIVNEGKISSGLGTYIALLAPEVRNQGVVLAQFNGTVAMAAGEIYRLQFNSHNQLINVLVTPGNLQTLIENRNLVEAPGGLIILSAQAATALMGGIVKNSGTLSANGFVNDGGVVRLSASHKIELLPSSVITADAAKLSDGKGGRIEAIADLNNPESRTQVDGLLSAKGGDRGGDGGFIETSSANLNIHDGAKVSTLAPLGKAGQWLLDPNDFTVADAGGNLSTANLLTALNANNVTITTTSGNASCTSVSALACGTGTTGNGDITISNALSGWTGNALILSAYRNVNINAAITGAGNSSLSITSATGGNGLINVGAAITTAGDQLYTGNLYLLSTVSLTTTNNGAVTITGSVTGPAPTVLNQNVLQLFNSSYTGAGNYTGTCTGTATTGCYALSTNSTSTYSVGSVQSGGVNLTGGRLSYANSLFTWTPTATESVQTLLVAGGGGSGWSNNGGAGGGGGAGAIGYGNLTLSGGVAYGVKVGAGGLTGSTGGPTRQGSNGGLSSLIGGGLNESANGGGGGGTAPGNCCGSYNGVNGGSSGGSNSNFVTTATRGTGTLTYLGNAGGNPNIVSSIGYGGTGGGALSAGQNAGVGGLGYVSAITGLNTTYAQGGGTLGGNTIANTGNGGSGYNGPSGASNKGAAGIVILGYGGQQVAPSNNISISTGTGQVNISGEIATAGSVYVNSKSPTSLLNGKISGAVGLSYNAAGNYTGANAGVLQLNGLNTLTGGIRVAGGTLKAANSSAFGVSASGLQVDSDATLDLNGQTIASSNSLTLNGAGVNGSGAVLNSNQLTASFPGAVSLQSDSSVGGVGDVTLSGQMMSNGFGIVLQGNGSKSLSDLANGLTTIATGASIGSLNIKNNSSLTIGQITLGGTTYSGIDSTGTISVATRVGDLTVSQSVATTNASAAALVLNAGLDTNSGVSTGGNVKFTGNPNISVGLGGVGKIFSGSVNESTGLNDVVGLGSGRFRYNSDEISSNFTTTIGTGLYGIYREQPAISSIAVDNKSITYTDALPSWTFSLNGAKNGDTLLQVFTANPSVSAGGTTSSSGNFSAGDHALTASGNTGASKLGYALFTGTYVPGVLTVSPKTLTVSYTGVNKVYDGNTAATVLTADDRVQNDFLSILRNAAFADKDAANAKAVAVSDVSLTGVDAGNYRLASNAGTTTANITKAQLVITANADSRFVTQNDVTGFKGATYRGLVGGDSEALLGGGLSITRTNAVNDQGAGEYAGVLVPSGRTSSNYDISYVNGNYTIAPADRLLVSTENQTISYGTTPTFTTTAKYLSSTDNQIKVLTQTGTHNNYTFSDGVGTSISMILKPYLGANVALQSTSGSTVIGNYVVQDLAYSQTGTNFNGVPLFSGVLSVLPKAITPNATSPSKTYDGTVAASNITLGMQGKVANDILSIGGEGAFSQKNAGSNLNYAITGLQLSGADTGNYYLTGGLNFISGNDGVINKANAIVTSNSNVGLTYNGVNQTVSGFTATGLVNGETAAVLTGITASRTEKNAGTYVTAASGTDGNYNLSFVDGSMVIAKTPLTATGNSASVRYNGSDQTVSGLTVSGLQGTDNLASLSNLTSSGATAKNAGSYVNTVTAGVQTNYTVSTVNGALEITKADAVVTARSDLGLTYNGLNQTVSGFTATGLVGGEAVGVLTGVTASRTEKNAGTYVTTASGTDGNYNLSFVDGSMVIAKAPLTATGNSASVRYNGSNQTVSGLTVSGLQGNDTLASLSNLTSSGATAKNAGSYVNTVTAGVESNYTVSTVNGALEITKADAVVTARSDLGLTYNGVNQTVSGFTATGLVGGETATVLTGVTASRTEKNAGTYVTTASGTDGNYNLSFADGSMVIAKAPLSIAAVNGTKQYDGTAHSGGFGISASGFVNNETQAELGGTLSYVGTSQGAINAGNYVVTPAGLTSGNYDLNYTSASLTINPAVIVVVPPPAPPPAPDPEPDPEPEPSYTFINGAIVGGVSKVYDGTNKATLLPRNFSLLGFASGEGATVTKSQGTYDTPSAGTAKMVSISLTEADYRPVGYTNFSNYILPSSLSGRVGVISKAPLVVNAVNAAKIYDGQSYTGGNGVNISGFVNGEAVASLVGSIAYTGSSQGAKEAGTYAITPTGLSSSNYAIKFNSASLEIAKLSLMVKADQFSKPFMSADPALTYTVSGLPAAASASAVLTGSLVRVPGESLGAYVVNQGSLVANSNYDLKFESGNLQITPGVLSSASSVFPFQAKANVEGLRFLEWVPLMEVSCTNLADARWPCHAPNRGKGVK